MRALVRFLTEPFTVDVLVTLPMWRWLLALIAFLAWVWFVVRLSAFPAAGSAV